MDSFFFLIKNLRSIATEFEQLKAGLFHLPPIVGNQILKYSRLSSIPGWKQNKTKHQPSHRGSADAGRRTKTAGIWGRKTEAVLRRNCA